MPRVESILRYPGGKSQLYNFVRNVIIDNNIENPIYVEPFAGGAGVALKLLLNEDVSKIIINDFDPAIHAIWYNVLNKTDEFIQLINDTEITLEEWYRQKSIYFDLKESENSQYNFLLGFAAFFLNRTNISGIIQAGPIGGIEQNGNYKINCRFKKQELIEKIENIASKRHSIILYYKDTSQFIKENIKRWSTSTLDRLFIFFDPPYYVQGKNLYTNFFIHKDHIQLKKDITSLRNIHWIATYDFHDSIGEIYSAIPTKFYQLNYSAGAKRKEYEYMFHNENTILNGYGRVVIQDYIERN